MSLRRAPTAPVKTRKPVTARARAQDEDVDPNDELASALDKRLYITNKGPGVTKSATRAARATAGQPLKPTTPSARQTAAAPKSKPQSILSPTERAREAMSTVNACLQALTAHSKAGWRATTDASPLPPSRSTSTTSRAPSSSTASSSRSNRNTSPSTSITATSQSSRDRVAATARSCGEALAQLRQLIRQKSIASKATDIEKAAGNMIANLVEMEMFDLALRELASMHASVTSWFDPSVSLSSQILNGVTTEQRISPSSFANLYSLPLPAHEAINDNEAMPLKTLVTDVVPLVIAMQQYVIVCLFRSSVADAEARKRNVELQRTIVSGGTAIDWCALLERVIGECDDMEQQRSVILRKADAMLTSVFATITKGCVGADAHTDPQVLLDIRSHALLAFAHTSPLYSAPGKIDSFLEQARKVLLLYGRQAEQRGIGNALVNASVKVVFDKIVGKLDERGANKIGKMWTALCEVVQHIAKRADDLISVERMSLLLGEDGTSDITPDQQADGLCAKLTSSMSVLELFFKSGQDNGVGDHAQRAISLLEALSSARTSSQAVEAWPKIDKTAERLRFIVARHIRGSRRLDELVMATSNDESRQDKTVQDALLKLLDDIVRLYETVCKSHARAEIEMVSGTHPYDSAVESIIILSYSRLCLDKRQSYATVADTLERGQLFVTARSANGQFDSEALPSIKSLASTWFNVGGILFNASKPEHAVRFVQRSCELTDQMLRLDEALESVVVEGMRNISIKDDTEDLRQSKDEAMRELRRHSVKRWELLGMCRHAIGDKKLALAAFEQAVFASATIDAPELEKTTTTKKFSGPTRLSEQFPTLYRLVHRSTKLATFELLHDAKDVGLFARATSHDVPRKVAALLLEMQAHCLTVHVDRAEACDAISAIVRSLLDEYVAAKEPLRRARVLLWQMQTRLVGESSDESQALRLAEEVRSLCERPLAKDDTATRHLCRQFSAMSHLWTAVQVVRVQHPERHVLLPTEAEDALQALHKCLDSASDSDACAPAQTKAAAKSAISSRLTTSTRPADKAAATAAAARKMRTTRAKPESSTVSAFKTPQPRRALDRTVPQTTPPRKTLLSGESNLETRDGPNQAVFEDADELVDALLLLANILGATGHALIRVACLRLVRRLCGKGTKPKPQVYAQASTYLALEYARLGRLAAAQTTLDQASAHLAETQDDDDLTAHANVELLLAKSALFAETGHYDASEREYEAALTLADKIESRDAHPSTAMRVQGRTRLLQRAASAASAFSSLQRSKGELVRSLEPAMQSMRVWTRALSNVNRLAAQPVSTKRSETAERGSDTFDSDARDPKAALPEHPSASRKKFPVLSSGPYSTVAWHLAECTGEAILRVARLNMTRGVPKAAEHYASAALDLGEDVVSSWLIAQALAVRAEVKMKLGRMAEALRDLEAMQSSVSSGASPELVLHLRLQAEFCARGGDIEGANEALCSAFTAMDELQQAAALHVGPTVQLGSSLRRSLTTQSSPKLSASQRARAAAEPVLASQHAALLRMRLRLGGSDELEVDMKRLAELSMSTEDTMSEGLVRAILLFDDLIARFASDPTLGILPDSVLSLPTFCSTASTSVRLSLPRSGHESHVASVQDVDRLLQQSLALAVSRTDPAHIRQISLLSATLQSFKQCVSRALKGSPAGVAHVLDLSLAVALRRDMLEVVERRFVDPTRHDDLVWPCSVAPTHKTAQRSADDAVWQALRERYSSEAPERSLDSVRMQDVLPEHWTAVSIHLSADRDCLIIVRYTRGSDPVVVRAPLDRMARREGEDESLTYDAAIAELRDIIGASNRGAQDAKNVDGREARAAWWAERKELDSRLKQLLEGIENDWLAAFKSILLTQRFDNVAFGHFVTRVEDILKRSIVRAAQDKRASKFKLDKSIVKCFASLPSSSREEDFEDVYHFAMESFQLSGIPAACDEVDVDQVVLDLRSAFEELHNADREDEPAPPSADKSVDGQADGQHLLLMLDKTLQPFPWESLPCLRGKSVSRVPSLSFVRDRLDLARNASGTHKGRLVVDAHKTSFVLNPAKDLANTQKTFEPWLEHQRRATGWTGITARAPSDDEMRHSLSTSDLVLYFGHGGAEQYARSQTIRNLSKCATTMLWGCSSGTLKSQGDFELTGTPYHYMIARCPALVANLWDVTDKDIDKFAVDVFDQLGLWVDSSTLTSSSSARGGTVRQEQGGGGTSLTEAVARSRNVPLLKYLNGAAPVVYGVPVWFK
ncbi:hypothetical protein ACM66B_003520 [Microbotryomycetes sp. NB124-2]